MAFFHYIVLQNFYTYSVTVKQSKASSNAETRKSESGWVTILKDYQLMRNAHFETDAQNWHIIGTELVSKFFTDKEIRIVQHKIWPQEPQIPSDLLKATIPFLARLHSEKHNGLYEKNWTASLKTRFFDLSFQH